MWRPLVLTLLTRNTRLLALVYASLVNKQRKWRRHDDLHSSAAAAAPADSDRPKTDTDSFDGGPVFGPPLGRLFLWFGNFPVFSPRPDKERPVSCSWRQISHGIHGPCDQYEREGDQGDGSRCLDSDGWWGGRTQTRGCCEMERQVSTALEARADCSDPMRGLTSMSPNPANSNEVVAGGNGLILANTSTGQIVRRVSVTPSTM